MKIFRAKKLETQIIEAARTYLESQERAEGLHFSDFLSPRKAYFRMTDPQPLTLAEIGYFIAGRAHHEVILAIMRRQKKIGAPEEQSKEWEGSFYTPDFNLGFLAEIKSTRRQNAPADEPDPLRRAYKHYLKQLAQYMAAEKKNKAALVVFYLSLKMDDKNKTTIPSIRAYQVEMTDDELSEVRNDMRVTKKLIQIAVEKKDHRPLPLCPAWMCCSGGYRGPAVANCKWYEQCKPEGRYPEAAYAEARKRGDFDEE